MTAEAGRLVRCPICQVVNTREEFEVARGPAAAYPLVRCRSCGLTFQKFLPTAEQLDLGQQTTYGEPGRRFSAVAEAGIRLFRASRVRLARKLLAERGRVLDVGCGRGIFLHLLKTRGYQVQGTELSDSTAANAYADIPIEVGDLRPGQFLDNSFDLISIWHVLEHLRHPDVTLQACQRALKPGGALLVAVPNFRSVQAGLGGDRWFHLDLPRHIYHFGPDTLERLLTRNGFRIERLRTGQWEMDPFGLLQTVLNRCGLRHNALFDSLHNHPGRSGRFSAPYRWAMLLLLPLGMSLALPWCLLFQLLGRGGSLIVVARKDAP